MATDRLWDSQPVILDTNALFLPFQFKLNLDSELNRLLGDYQIIIPRCIYRELHRLKDKEKFGHFALKLAKKKKPPVWYQTFEKEFLIKLERERKNRGLDRISIDTELLQIAKAVNGIVLTNDSGLLKDLKDLGLQTISLRAKKYLKLNTID